VEILHDIELADVREAYMARADVAALTPEQREERWAAALPHILNFVEWIKGEEMGALHPQSWQCSKCGSDAGFSVSRRVNGWESWAYYGRNMGAVEHCTDDNVRRSWPATGICFSCDKRVPIPPRNALGQTES
jgi:hypothetical protein